MFNYLFAIVTLLFSCAAFASDTQEHSTVGVTEISAVSSVLPDDFQALVLLRKNILAEQSQLDAELRKKRAEQQVIAYDAASIDSTISRITSSMQDLESQIAELEAIIPRTDIQDSTLQELKGYFQSDKYHLQRAEDDKKRYLENQTRIGEIELLLGRLINNLVPVEQKIADYLNIEEERNTFRTWISIAFCILVAIVIIGFYVIAWKKELIAESIFSGEKGIQFVTIFLLVIAIILFGIMGILESKELSALLGGLSGYILGRVGGQVSNNSRAESVNAG